MKLFKILSTLFAVIAVLAAAFGPASVTPAYAASLVVNTAADTDDGTCNTADCTLREAINAANAASDADTITFAADYVITLSSQLPDVTTQIAINGNGVTRTVIQASACNPVAIACAHSYSPFYVNHGNLSLSNLTVQNGQTPYGFPGGNIRVNHGTLGLNTVVVRNGHARDGGGIYADDSTVNLVDSSVSGNLADDGSSGSIDVGGGIFTQDSNLTIANSAVYNNSASSAGGGIWFGSISLGLNNSFQIANSVISGNSSTSDGGILLSASHLSGLTGVITNSVISDNTGGVGAFGATVSVTLTNTIIANNSGADCSTSSAPLIDGGNNLIENSANACGLTHGVNGNIVGQDPQLGALTDNGGPTPTHALLAGSPAIDTGKDSACAVAPINNLDQRGVTRPQGAHCDIGSYEYGAIIPTVTTTNPAANATLTSLSSIVVTFNQNMLNDGSSKAANYIPNYLLVEWGANKTFETQSCRGGLLGDDVSQIIGGILYINPAAILTLANPLTNGNYRLFICGTTSIWSVAGLELNNGNNDAVVDFTVAPTTTASTTSTKADDGASSLPKTGFAPNKITTLLPQPANLAYASMSDIWIEIPALNLKSNIVGVPKVDGGWNVSWLGADTGWLNGSAFPTWKGNSVLTAHVTDANGQPGPFANLKNLSYGDLVIVHLSGGKYIFEVRESRMVRPYSTGFAFESKQDASYLTLITCQGYNPLNESYIFRRVVRAVLVEVSGE